MKTINRDRLRQLAELLRRLDDARNGGHPESSAVRAQAQAAAITGGLPDFDSDGSTDYAPALAHWLTEESTRYVFVYGTLKSGGGNHYILEGDGAVFIDTAKVEGYGLTPGGGFPYAIPSKDHTATGEVYAVDDATFARLDGLEGFPYHYGRDHVDVRLDNAEGFKWVTAWIYVANERVLDTVSHETLVETWVSPVYEYAEEDDA